jgi:hypothetical protein
VSWLVGSGAVLPHTAIKSVLLFVAAVVGFRLGERRTLAAFDFVAVIRCRGDHWPDCHRGRLGIPHRGDRTGHDPATHRLITRLRYPGFARLVD